MKKTQFLVSALLAAAVSIATLSTVAYAAGTVVQIFNGGTGTSTAPSYGQVLLGNGSGGYNLTATSSLGISASGAVSSVSNVDGTLTISPTTGAVVASLKLSNPNSWTGLQQFNNATSTLLGATTAWVGTLNLTNALTVANGGTGVQTLSGLVKGNGTSAFTAAANGTDFSLITANTCGSGHFSTVTTAGVFGCTADSGGSWPFSATSYNGVNAQSTSSLMLFTGSLSLAASTSQLTSIISSNISVSSIYATTSTSTTMNANTGTVGSSTIGVLNAGTFNVNNLASLASGFVSQSSSTVVGNFTSTGNQTVGGTLGVSGLSTLSAFLSNGSSTVTSGLFTMNGGASTTNFTASGTAYSAISSSTNAYISSTGKAAGAYLAADPTGKVIATTSPGSVTSIATNNGITGGTITTSGTIGLATINANSVLANQTSASAAPTGLATSSLYIFTGSGGTVVQSAAPTLTGITTLAAASTTNGTFGTSLMIPNSSNPSPTLTGYITQSSNAPYQLHVGGNGATGVYDYRRAIVMPYGTSTTWTGTSSASTLGVVDYWTVPMGITVTDAMCYSPSGTVGVDAYYGSTHLGYFVASSTVGDEHFSSNNTPATGNVFYTVYGTPVSSPTAVSCTFLNTITGV